MRVLALLSLAEVVPIVLVSAWISGCTGPSTGKAPAPSREPVPMPDVSWSKQKQAVHLLNRAAFGPSPGDLEDVVKNGPGAWLSRQLEPGGVPDASLEKRLADFPILTYSPSRMYEEFPRPEAIAQAKGTKLDDAGARERLRDLVAPEKRPREIERQLSAQKLLRAAESQRQLQEVLTDFWFNHFNVSIEKGQTRWLITSYERDAIRPHVVGKFRDLLGATAHHPAMLFYLDNWTSSREGLTRRELVAGAAREMASRDPLATAGEVARNRLGLNENYARELLELHTVGVDAGYSQQDVRDVARCFTGWSMGRPRSAGVRFKDADPGTFVFRVAAHDAGSKSIMGLVIPAGGGMDDGEKVLDFLARHPATAHRVAFKLAQKFVSDDPPPSLVERLASVFLQSDGDLSLVYRALFSSPEFWSEEAWLAKTKTPLEFAVSAIRATGATTDGGPLLTKELGQMGQPLYRCQPPTGYKETADAWITPGALVARMNFAVSLTSGRVYGTELPAPVAAPDRSTSLDSEIDRLALKLLGRPLSPASRKVLLDKLAADPPTSTERREPLAEKTLAALILGSPDFQKQ